MPDEPKPEPPAAPPATVEETSRLGRFITKYHTFVSSFVIGVTGLIATSIWQFRQSETTRNQAESQQKVAETAAANSWKIERADILSKNLAVLASSGPDTVEQRYGVLLSLTRGQIIDPELAVSYALELGRDNADDMMSVLANTSYKDYARLSRAFELSCEEKYGTTPGIDACSNKLGPRSEAIGQLFADEIHTPTPGAPGPLQLLADERQVQINLQLYVGLYETALINMYEHRGWDEVTKFAAFSPGAHLVSALILAAARTGEFVTDDEAKVLEDFHGEQTRWLTAYLTGKTCDAECKGRMLEVMVSHYQEAQGDFDTAIRTLLESPRAQAGVAISRLHARLLWCQLDDADLVPLRDRALVPAATQLLKTPPSDPAIREAVISLLAVVNEPTPTEPEAEAAWAAMLAQLDKTPAVAKLYKERRTKALKERATPPVALRKINFCSAVPPPDPGIVPP